MDTKVKGERSEAMIMAALLRAGKIVLRPWGDSQRYDIAIDEGGGRISRIQCKTGRLKSGALQFPTCSSNAQGKKRSYQGEIEYFAVYAPQSDKVYLIPAEATAHAKYAVFLRLEPTKNGQSKGIRLASEYELKTGS